MQQFLIQNSWQVASYILLGVDKETDSSMQITKLSPLGEACSRVDLDAIHDILEKLGYNDHARIAQGVSLFLTTNS